MFVKLLLLLYVRMHLAIVLALIICSIISAIILVFSAITKNMRASRNVKTPVRIDDAAAKESMPVEQEPSDASATATSKSIRKFYQMQESIIIMNSWFYA